MSKIHFLQSKETTIGFSLLFGVVVLLIINIIVVASSLIVGYGAKKNGTTNRTINDSVLSQAVNLLELKE
jgi:hypothetical protein